MSAPPASGHLRPRRYNHRRTVSNPLQGSLGARRLRRDGGHHDEDRAARTEAGPSVTPDARTSPGWASPPPPDAGDRAGDAAYLGPPLRHRPRRPYPRSAPPVLRRGPRAAGAHAAGARPRRGAGRRRPLRPVGAVAPSETVGAPRRGCARRARSPPRRRARAGRLSASAAACCGCRERVRAPAASRALALDAATVRASWRRGARRRRRAAMWDAVVRPVLARVADRWASTGAGVEIEHLLSECIGGVLAAHAAARPRRAEPAGPCCSRAHAGRAAHAAAGGARGRCSPTSGSPAGRSGRTCPADRARAAGSGGRPRPPSCCGRSGRRRPTSRCWAPCRRSAPVPRLRPPAPAGAVGAAPRGCSRLTTLVEAADALRTAARWPPAVSPALGRRRFGSTPHRSPPRGRRPRERWLVAVALGGQGHYAAAAAELERLAADPPSRGGSPSHAAVTRAAHLRQLGGHAVARSWDARGAAPGTRTVAVQPAGCHPAAVATARGGVTDAATPGRTSGRRGSTRWSGWPPTPSGWATRPGRSGCSPPRRPRWRPTPPGGPRPGPAGCRPSWPSSSGRPAEAVAPAEAALAAAASRWVTAARAQVPDRARRRPVGRRGDDSRGRPSPSWTPPPPSAWGWGCYRCAGLRASPRST